MKTFLTAILILFSTNMVLGQATAKFTASATIIQPINISTVSNLNFANIDAREGGEIILTPQAERIATGAVDLADGAGVTAAAFEVTGEQGFTFAVNLPKGSFRLINGSESLVIKDFTSSLGSPGELGSGKTTIKVGATLEVQPEQSPGYYSTPAPLSVTVNYN